MNRDWDVFPNKPLMLMIIIVTVIYSVINALIHINQFYKMVCFGVGAIMISIAFLIIFACDNFFSATTGKARFEVGKMVVIAYGVLFIGAGFVAVAEFLM